MAKFDVSVPKPTHARYTSSSEYAISFKHLFRLTDDVGLLEHAHYFIPRRKEGYTTDDNARALEAVLSWSEVIPDSSLKHELLHLSEVYLSFLAWAVRDDGRFHNNFSYSREKEPEHLSDDCDGRALYALAMAQKRMPHPEHRRLAADLLRRSLPHAEKFKALRGIAYALSTVVLLLEDDDMHTIAEKQTLRMMLDDLAQRLIHAYMRTSNGRWRWFEPQLTYSNGLLPWSLWQVVKLTGKKKVRTIAEDSFNFLQGIMLEGDPPYVRPVGNRGWGTPKGIAMWDQQPIDVYKLALAALAAYEATGEARYAQLIERSRAWFYGDNVLSVMMIEPSEGAAFDGLTPHGANENAGAEALISYLLSEWTYWQALNIKGETPRVTVCHNTMLCIKKPVSADTIAAR